jgi:hypothetical protein
MRGEGDEDHGKLAAAGNNQSIEGSCGGGVMSMRVAIALLLMAVLPATSFADEAPLQETAVRALRWAFYAPNGYRWEFSGILVIRDGQLTYSPFPSTLKLVDAVGMDVEKQRLSGDTLVGLYHTHPCKPDAYFSQYFSPADLISAFFYHVPTFILDECTGKVHEFDPVQDRAADSGIVVRMLMRDGKKRWLRLPAGRVVGDIGDQGPDLSLIERLMAATPSPASEEVTPD